MMSDVILKRNDMIDDLNTRYDNFIKDVAREMEKTKTAVHKTRAYAEILLTQHLGELTPKQKERIDIIKNHSSTLFKNIKNFIHSRLEKRIG